MVEYFEVANDNGELSDRTAIVTVRDEDVISIALEAQSPHAEDLYEHWLA